MVGLPQGDLAEVRTKMVKALALIKEAVDESLPFLDSGERGKVIGLWEEFLREFFRYVKKKSRETGQNLFACLSFRRIWIR